MLRPLLLFTFETVTIAEYEHCTESHEMVCEMPSACQSGSRVPWTTSDLWLRRKRKEKVDCFVQLEALESEMPRAHSDTSSLSRLCRVTTRHLLPAEPSSQS